MATVWDFADLIQSPAAWMLITGGVAGVSAWRGLTAPLSHAKRARDHESDVEWLNSPLPAFLPFTAGVSPPTPGPISSPVRCGSCGAMGKGGHGCAYCGNPLPHAAPPRNERAGVLTPQEARERITGNLATLWPNGSVVPFRGGRPSGVSGVPRKPPTEIVVRIDERRPASVVGFPRKQSQGRPPAPRMIPIVDPDEIRSLVSGSTWQTFADEIACHGRASIVIERFGRIGDRFVAPGHVFEIEDGPPDLGKPRKSREGQRERRSDAHDRYRDIPEPIDVDAPDLGGPDEPRRA